MGKIHNAHWCEAQGKKGVATSKRPWMFRPHWGCTVSSVSVILVQDSVVFDYGDFGRKSTGGLSRARSRQYNTPAAPTRLPRSPPQLCLQLQFDLSADPGSLPYFTTKHCLHFNSQVPVPRPSGARSLVPTRKKNSCSSSPRSTYSIPSLHLFLHHHFFIPHSFILFAFSFRVFWGPGPVTLVNNTPQ